MSTTRPATIDQINYARQLFGAFNNKQPIQPVPIQPVPIQSVQPSLKVTKQQIKTAPPQQYVNPNLVTVDSIIRDKPPTSHVRRFFEDNLRELNNDLDE